MIYIILTLFIVLFTGALGYMVVYETKDTLSLIKIDKEHEQYEITSGKIKGSRVMLSTIFLGLALLSEYFIFTDNFFVGGILLSVYVGIGGFYVLSMNNIGGF